MSQTGNNNKTPTDTVQSTAQCTKELKIRYTVPLKLTHSIFLTEKNLHLV